MHGDMVNGVTLKVCMAGRPNRGDFTERRSFEGKFSDVASYVKAIPREIKS